MALDMARLEWARVVAFDGRSPRPVVTADVYSDRQVRTGFSSAAASR